MMTGHMKNQMRQQAQGVLNMLDHGKSGIVQNYDKTTYSCRVLIQPENELTGWIPIMSLWVGNGWGMFAPPAPGAAAIVLPREGLSDAAFICGALFNDVDRPRPVDQGEFWLVHESGASFKLTNNGALAINDGNGASVTLNGDGTVSSSGMWTHDGDFTATGDVTDSARSMADDRIIYNSHIHGSSPPPNPQQ
jgi:phage baseplate assembly protein V